MNSDAHDCEYHPVLADATSVLRAAAPSHFLLAGEPLHEGEGLPDGFEDVADARHLSAGDTPDSLPTGNYVFRRNAGCSVMLVTSGATPVGPARGNATPGGESFPDRSLAWFNHLWDQAQPIPRPGFVRGDAVVTVPGDRETTVYSRRFGGGEWRYRVRLDGRLQTFREGGLAHASIDDDPLEWVRRPPGGMRAIAATLTRAKLDGRLTDTVYSFGATRTVFRGYQFLPVIKLLRTGRSSMLLADEVGLGKTIEAGLVWTELDARRQADSVLVVCPSGLVEKWRQEMLERFGFELDRLDATRLDELLEQFEADRVPARFRGVCSLERLRRWEGLARLNRLAPHFDLVIVDEAHAMRNLGTLSHALGSQLKLWAGTLLFLSATPLNLGNDDLFNLLTLLDDEFDDRHALETRLEPNRVLNRIAASLANPTIANHDRRSWLQSIRNLTFGRPVTSRPEYERLDELLALEGSGPAARAEATRLITELNTLSSIVTRTRKAEVQEDRTVREPHEVAVELTGAERRLYDTIHDWQRRRAEARNMPVGFIGQMPLRLAGSCLQAAKRQILAMSQGTGVATWGDEDGAFDDTSGSEDDGTPGLDGNASDPHAWDAPPVEVVAAAGALGDVDTKFEQFIAALDGIVQQGRKVLVFTFSRPTITYLSEHLTGSGFRICVLHGGVPPRDRPGIIRRFREGEFDVMLATRVAGEGLDFEFCSAVVNYDLPWNPMEVEQRIGRIDRFGQEEEMIRILNFHTPGTIESDIISRVHARIGVFTAAIGELEPILRSELPELRRTMFDFTLSPQERNQRLDQTLTAIEIRAGLRQEIEDAADALNVLDNAEVDGFENEVRLTGRYIGQPELVWLLEDWADSAPGADCRRADHGPWLHLTGNAAMAENLLGLQADRERSSSETAALHADLRNESEITLCLDQETARRQGADLLNATHPLVRAALRVPQAGRTPYGAVRVRAPEAPPGHYLVLVAVARWNGVRPATELWTAAVTPNGEPAGEGPGSFLLAALAESRLEPASRTEDAWVTRHVWACAEQLDAKHTEDEEGRRAENRQLVEARQISLTETHRRKVAGIQGRIEALGTEANPQVLRLFQSQLENQEYGYQEALRELDEARAGALSRTEIALCSLEVVR